MRIYSGTTLTGVVLTALLCAFSALGRDHSALNGTWTLAPTKSDFRGEPVVQTGTVTISDRQGVIIVLKVTSTQSGAVTLESYALSADGDLNVSVVRPNHKPITLVFQRQ